MTKKKHYLVTWITYDDDELWDFESIYRLSEYEEQDSFFYAYAENREIAMDLFLENEYKLVIEAEKAFGDWQADIDIVTGLIEDAYSIDDVPSFKNNKLYELFIKFSERCKNDKDFRLKYFNNAYGVNNIHKDIKELLNKDIIKAFLEEIDKSPEDKKSFWKRTMEIDVIVIALKELRGCDQG